MGEENMSLYSSPIPSTCFCYKERLCVEVTNVATTFCLLWAWITKKKNFPIWEMTFLHCLVEIKEITLGGTASSILYNFLFKVIITLWGLDSYTTWRFHKKVWPKRTSQNSRGATSDNTSCLKGLISYNNQHYWLTWRSLPWLSHLMV